MRLCQAKDFNSKIVPEQASSFSNGDYLSTLSNLCSDAKTLSVEVKGSNITLIGAGGTRPKLLDRGLLVGNQARLLSVLEVCKLC